MPPSSRCRLLGAAACGAALFPAWAGAAGWTPELAFKVKRVSTVRVSPDGRRVAFVVGTAVMEGEKSEWLSHVHLARSDGSGSFQLTRATSRPPRPPGRRTASGSPSSRPRGAKDRKDAKANLWRIRVDGGEAERSPTRRAASARSPGRPTASRIAFVMTDPQVGRRGEGGQGEARRARGGREPQAASRLYVVPVEKDADGKRPVRRLTAGDVSVGNIGGPGAFDWSPDGQARSPSTHQPTPHIDDWPRADVSVVEVAPGAVRAAPGHARPPSPAPRFSPDGRTVAYRGHQRPAHLAAPVAAGRGSRRGRRATPLAATPDEQPDLVGWTADGRAAVHARRCRTVTRCVAARRRREPGLAHAGRRDGRRRALSASGTHLGFTSQAPDRAPEAFVSRAGRATRPSR